MQLGKGGGKDDDRDQDLFGKLLTAKVFSLVIYLCVEDD